MIMAHAGSNYLAALYLQTAALLLISSSCLVASFTSHSKRIYAQTHSLAAYLPGVDSYSGGRDSFRNNTLNDQSSIPAHVEVDDDEFDTVGAGTLGDIMAGSAPNTELQNNANTNPSQTAIIDGLVTKEGGELNAKFGCRFSPMERIALTANGNLQRIFSSYYDAPIHVHVDCCTRRDTNQYPPVMHSNEILDTFIRSIDIDDAVWDRVVHLHVYEQTLCKASSVIHVRSPECINLIEKGTVGLGQLFRYLNRLPTFKLLDAGRTDFSSGVDANFGQSAFQGGIWRTYELKCEEMTCLIHEEFHRDAWDIAPGTSRCTTQTYALGEELS